MDLTVEGWIRFLHSKHISPKHFRSWTECRVRTVFFVAWEDRTSLGLELGFWMSSRTKRTRSPKTLRQSGGNFLRQNSLPKIKCLAFNSFRNSVSKELRKAGPPKTSAQGPAPCSTRPCCSLQKGLQRSHTQGWWWNHKDERSRKGG